jgi:hypothetical protein
MSVRNLATSGVAGFRTFEAVEQEILRRSGHES